MGAAAGTARSPAIEDGMRRGRRWVTAALSCLLLGGCTSAPPDDVGPDRESREAVDDGAAPWPDRPVVDLRFETSRDLGRVAGRELVEFTPDLEICELVFRAWPNKPVTAQEGTLLTVSQVRVDGRAAAFLDVAAGASQDTPAGTLVEVPLADCVDAGETVTAELTFALELGEEVDERVGTSPDAEVAWLATAFPLLAWERGRGWQRGPAVPVNGETAVSEDFRLDSLEVVAPDGYEVLGTGEAGGTEDRPDGTTVHRFSAPAVRDVAVAVGDLDVVERTINGVRVRVGLDREVEQADADDWLDQIAESTRDLIDLLGPFPYDDLWVVVLSSQTSGIEFPGAIQFGDVDPDYRRGLVTHELAHMWFYGLVGNDQGQHPWLDESFATFAQSVADGDELSLTRLPVEVAPPVGGSMLYWASNFQRPNSTYFDTVYTIGGAALVEARTRAGAEAFDAALADYLAANAHSVATPNDVREAFNDLPDVLDVLREVGALP
ncbi:M1 family aminopeptidase [Geodermatophilus sp. YIM 151500]|uniref:M1 family aminopeptidase n=1 Tax=Geodermatophilus sp. YIM 151500 TaxID=2984531 RepID=UPI0021E3A0A1|nr:M1 family aminopeptidase [Geodermatophilus sp. YIM 151500]MCV2490680.1 M1 family aminopeptidase [Geodermatophilus sp. YIM 151500]